MIEQEDALEDLDKDGDGQISYEEFEHWWRVKEVEGLPMEAVCEGLAEADFVKFCGKVFKKLA